MYSILVLNLFICIMLFSVLVSTMNTEKVSDIIVVNVEAWASGETEGQPMDCYQNVENKDDGRPAETQTYCGDCQPIKCTHWYGNGRCVR